MWTFVRRLALLAAFFCAFTARAQTVDGVVVDGDDDEAIAPTLATVFSDNFEGGIGNWSADNGVWEVGTPTSGPNGCHQGEQCAATVLGGDYPSDTSSRLISPAIVLPTVTTKQDIQLRFWSWYLLAASARAAVGTWMSSACAYVAIGLLGASTAANGATGPPTTAFGRWERQLLGRRAATMVPSARQSC